MCGTNIFCLQVISKSVRLFPPGAEDPGTNFFLFNNMFFSCDIDNALYP